MIVTISNQYASGAVAIARRAADQLGYAVVDRELPVVVAKRLNVAASQVDDAEDRGPSIAQRVLYSLESATPEAGGLLSPRFDEQCLREVQEAVREFAARDNVVIIGRGAGLILGRRSGVLRVFMHAPRDWRIERAARQGGVDRVVAAAEVDRVDRARRAYLREWYGADFGAADHYELSLDTERFGEAAAAALVVAALNAR